MDVTGRPARHELDVLARTLARRRDDVVDGVFTVLRDLARGAPPWTERERRAVRAALDDLLDGFLRFLRVGDLEANECARLRRLARTPPPGQAAGDAAQLARATRLDAIDVIARVLGTELTDRGRRQLERELQRYLGLVVPASPPATLGTLDDWLARIAAAGPDVAPAPGRTDTPAR